MKSWFCTLLASYGLGDLSAQGSYNFSYPKPSGHLAVCSVLLLPKSTIKIIEKVRSGLSAKRRQGWLDRGVPAETAETVWEHSVKLREAVICTHRYGQNEYDFIKLEDMALVHDLAEWLRTVPDFTPRSKESMDERFRVENAAFESLAKEDPAFQPVWDLWLEFERFQTPDVQFLKDLDRMDAVVQALVYEKQGYAVSDFYPDALEKVQDPTIRKILTILLKREFPTIDPYDQYFHLLTYWGDEVVFQRAMRMRLQKPSAFHTS